jgi:hypothetical protein
MAIRRSRQIEFAPPAAPDVSELLVRLFGERWFTTGQYSLTFTGKGVQQGDMLTCHAKVASVAPVEGGDFRISLDLRMQKDDGSTPVFGKARAVTAAPT